MSFTFSTVLFAGAISALIGVACGAFGAHALRARLSADLLAVWQTGVQYQLIHALALIVIALLMERRRSEPLLRAVSGLFVVGTVIFSGSLYLLALTGIRWLGAITPLGGVCFLTGWALLAFCARRLSGGPED